MKNRTLFFYAPQNAARNENSPGSYIIPGEKPTFDDAMLHTDHTDIRAIKKPARFLWRLALVSVLLYATGAIGETLWENGGEYVKTETHNGGANTHPFKIDPGLLGKALARLRVEPAKAESRDVSGTDDESTLPLFTPATAGRLADYIAEGLRSIGANEDVVFRSVDTAPLFGKLIGKQVFVSARVFWSNRRLNVIFGKIHKGVKKRWLFGQEKGYVNPPEPGIRSRAASLDLRVVEMPGVSNVKTRDGRKRIDWIAIEPRTLAETDPTTRPAVQPKPTKEKPAERHDSLEARLRRLEKLRDEGLISEQEYRRKRARILEEL